MNNNAIGIISAMYSPKSDFGNLLDKRTIATLPFGARYRLIDFSLSMYVNSGIKSVGIIAPFFYRSLIDHVGAGRTWNLDRHIGGLFIMPSTVLGVKDDFSRFVVGDLLSNSRILKENNSDYIVFSDASAVINFDLNELIDAHIKSKSQATFLYSKSVESENHLTFEIDNNSRVSKSIIHKSDSL